MTRKKIRIPAKKKAAFDDIAAVFENGSMRIEIRKPTSQEAFDIEIERPGGSEGVQFFAVNGNSFHKVYRDNRVHPDTE